jgi:integrase/transcription elongation factor Elf1
MTNCPQCGNSKLYKDGFRYTIEGQIQRLLCRTCGYRFSEGCNNGKVKVHVFPEQSKSFDSAFDLHDASVASGNLPIQKASEKGSFMFTKDVRLHNLTSVGKALYVLPSKYSNHRVCATTKGAKNLETATIEKVAGETETQQDVKGKLVEYAWGMAKRQLSEQTIKHRLYRLNVLVRKGADLTNPDSVETVLATEKWTPANKRFFVMAYQSFTKALKIEWIPLKIKCQSKQPFIPLESEIDALISGCGKRTSTLLQLLKDTGARIGEVAKLQWVDVDTETGVIRINNPEKGSASRTLKICSKTIAMIQALPKKSNYIFNTKTRSLESVFDRQRNKLAVKLQNPRLRQIHFHTFRHWKATTTYHKTRDILLVKYMLGHKRLENTEVYTHLIDFQNDEYHSATAKTIDEAKQLIESGFEYVTEMEGSKLFRKRK